MAPADARRLSIRYLAGQTVLLLQVRKSKSPGSVMSILELKLTVFMNCPHGRLLYCTNVEDAFSTENLRYLFDLYHVEGEFIYTQLQA